MHRKAAAPRALEEKDPVVERRRVRPWWLWLFALVAAIAGHAVGVAADHWWLPAMAGWCFGVLALFVGPSSGTGTGVLSSTAACTAARVLVCAGAISSAMASALDVRTPIDVVCAATLAPLSVLAAILWRRRFGVFEFTD